MHYTVIKKFNHRNAFLNVCIPVNFQFDYVQKLEEMQDDYDIIEINSLQSLCFYVNVENKNLKYAIEIVNNVENE